MTTIETILTIASAFGGLELLKWLYTRKSKGRLAQAEADIADIKTRSDEYQLLKERLDYLNSQMLDKEKRFAEQTDHVRKLTREVIDKEIEIGNYKAEIASLQAERKMKLCERRGCQQRQPQSGY